MYLSHRRPRAIGQRDVNLDKRKHDPALFRAVDLRECTLLRMGAGAKLGNTALYIYLRISRLQVLVVDHFYNYNLMIRLHAYYLKK